MSFSAVTDCPKCGNLDIHWLSPPKYRPETGNRHYDMLMAMAIGVSYDPPGTEVARVCKKCEHRWAVT